MDMNMIVLDHDKEEVLAFFRKRFFRNCTKSRENKLTWPASPIYKAGPHRDWSCPHGGMRLFFLVFQT